MVILGWRTVNFVWDLALCEVFAILYSTVEEILDQHPNIEDLELSGVDAMLMDIGVSSMQVNETLSHNMVSW